MQVDQRPVCLLEGVHQSPKGRHHLLFFDRPSPVHVAARFLHLGVKEPIAPPPGRRSRNGSVPPSCSGYPPLRFMD